MSDEQRVQNEIRSRLEDLQSSLSISTSPWNAWELEFIENICSKIDDDPIRLSDKQYEKVCDLWEKL